MNNLQQSAGAPVGTNTSRPGLSGAALKYLALILMALDHLYLYLPGLQFPALRWLGRLSAPIFFFFVAEGFWKTRSRGRYLLRLYLFSVVTSLLFSAAELLFPRADANLELNILATFTWVVALGCLFHRLAALWAARRWRPVVLTLLGLAAGAALLLFLERYVPFLSAAWSGDWSAVAQLAHPGSASVPTAAGGSPSAATAAGAISATSTAPFPTAAAPLLMCAAVVRALFPSPFLVEGGLIFVLFGILLIFCQGNRRATAAVFLLFSLCFLPYGDFHAVSLLYQNYQWMMVFALPLLLLYNGARGRQPKWLFYLFYPLHLLIFYLLPQFIG